MSKDFDNQHFFNFTDLDAERKASAGSYGVEHINNEESRSLDEIHEEKQFSYFDLLDKPKVLHRPETVTIDHLKQITYELGLIKLCWPDITTPVFEDRTNFPSSYLKNSEKEKVLLLYAENFRAQYSYKYPNRKPLFLACENECGMQKMVSTTIRPTTLPHPELETWDTCAKFVADHLKYEPFEDLPTLLPRHLYSPHTVFLRQSGHSFDLATALCSLLIGVGYDAYVVSGYAIKDVTLRIMSRVDSPFPPAVEEKITESVEKNDSKYKLKPPKDLRSKFLLMMERREIDNAIAEEQKLVEQKRLKILEEEQIPTDPLEGQRVHAWILLLAGDREIKETMFVEPSTGMSYSLDSPFYCGIESVWNHTNYWVNMQDCSKGLASINYNLSDTNEWEHLLIGEPINSRKDKSGKPIELDINTLYDEKHLDMPISWSLRISIPYEALKRRFADGMRTTYYKRTCVEEFAPYVSYDGLVTRITRFIDFDCTDVDVEEDYYENRHDKLYKTVHNVKNNLTTDFFHRGREDSVIEHIYNKNNDSVEAARTIFFNHQARYDALSKIQCEPYRLTEFYKDREDKLFLRQVTYVSPDGTADVIQGNRRPILKIIQKFDRDESKSANEDIAIQEFAIVDREIHLKFHYGKGNVTASTRTFIKPSISEMGEGMVFKPELTHGYQADIGAKPLRQLKLFLLFEEQLKEEEKVVNSIRDIEIQLADFLLTRAHEMAFTKLDVSLFNKEQNIDFRSGMLEKEEKQRVCKEKEVEEEIDYLAPYLARLGNPPNLSYHQALDAKYSCLNDFKAMLLERANVIQKNFDKMSEELQTKKNWFSANHDTFTPEQETQYFDEVNNILNVLRTFEVRMTRHKELSPLRYESMLTYLNNHPLLGVLR